MSTDDLDATVKAAQVQHPQAFVARAVLFAPDGELARAILADVLATVWSSDADASDVLRERRARGEHAILQEAAGRTLLDLARRAIARYDPVRHDPARILLTLARDAAISTYEQKHRTELPWLAAGTGAAV